MKFFLNGDYDVPGLLEYCPNDPPFTATDLAEVEWDILTTVEWKVQQTIVFFWLRDYVSLDLSVPLPVKRQRTDPEEKSRFEQMEYLSTILLYHPDSASIPPWEAAHLIEQFVFENETPWSERIKQIILTDIERENELSASPLHRRMRSLFVEKLSDRIFNNDEDVCYCEFRSRHG